MGHALVAEERHAVSYPVDLDEMSEDKLRAELVRREEARRESKCGYCGRSAAETSCKFPERHPKPVDRGLQIKNLISEAERAVADGASSALLRDMLEALKWMSASMESAVSSMTKVGCPYCGGLGTMADGACSVGPGGWDIKPATKCHFCKGTGSVNVIKVQS